MFSLENEPFVLTAKIVFHKSLSSWDIPTESPILKCASTGPKSWKLAWYNNRHVAIDANTAKSYCGKLVPILDDPDKSGDPMIIKVETVSDEYYFILFNRASGFNADTQEEGRNQVLVTKRDKNNLSWLQAKLSATATPWTISLDTNSGVDDILNVEVNSINLNNGPLGKGYASTPYLLQRLFLTSAKHLLKIMS